MKGSAVKSVLLAVLAGALVSGCATQRYQWGNYDEALYQSYKDPSKVESLRIRLEEHIAAMESGKQKVAPGLYAELGTLYLQSGQAPRAAQLYAKERDAWPESRNLMTALIGSIERRSAQAEVKP